MTAGAKVTGWGSSLPPTVLTNADLEALLDTSDAWIVERSGIRERRVDGVTSDMAVEAASAALDKAGVRPSQVDLMILSTSTPDRMVPATSSDIHHRLGLSGGAFDLNAACSGFVYALVTAVGMLGAGAQRCLVIGSDSISRITDPADRATAVLFGDGAGAVVLEAAPGNDFLLSWDLGVDGSALWLLHCEHGSYLEMEGREVFRRAVRVMVNSAQKALEQAKLTASDIDLVIPHQANERIIQAAVERLEIPMDRTVTVLDRTGNTSSASIPLTLTKAADASRLQPGDKVLLCGFGAGMTWASAVIRWSG